MSRPAPDLPFNGLTPAEVERLSWLAEECAEVIQAVTKILRHGYESRHPDAPPRCTNRWDLRKELGHLCASMDLMVDTKDVDWDGVDGVRAHRIEKRLSVKQYLHHQDFDSLPSVWRKRGEY